MRTLTPAGVRHRDRDETNRAYGFEPVSDHPWRRNAGPGAPSTGHHSVGWPAAGPDTVVLDPVILQRASGSPIRCWRENAFRLGPLPGPAPLDLDFE
jgi:hypothetical protein